MSISRAYALQHLNDPAVLCCPTESGTLITETCLEDPAIFPDLVDAELLDLTGCLTIGQVFEYSHLNRYCDSLTPITSEVVDAYQETIIYSPMSKLHVGNDYFEIIDAAARQTKQDLLVSGTNIKTINNTSLLGSGNISIGGTQVQIVRW